jgi:signal transduction histidine kinase
MTRDITRPAGLLAEISQLKGLAEMGKYAAELTHEIRNPLNSIEIQMTILSRLLTRLPNGLRDEVAGVVDIVRQENRRLNTLAGDFLTIRKSRQLSLSRFDVVNLLREVVVQLGPEAAGRGVALAAGGMDAGMVEGDREKLKQALINLVHNAIEAAAGVCGAAVRLACDGTDDGLKITVSDNGPGIPYEHQAKIFELFYTTKAFGTGLGLHVSRDIVAAHGGRLTFVSDPSGTVFTIRLPGLGLPGSMTRP